MKNLFLLLIIAFTACKNVAQNDSKIALIEIADAKELILNNKELIILDVRTEQEVAAGKIENAININYLEGSFKEEVSKLNKESKILVYCAVGGRSAKAASLLNDLGFKEVYDLKGGYNGWKNQK